MTFVRRWVFPGIAGTLSLFGLSCYLYVMLVTCHSSEACPSMRQKMPLAGVVLGLFLLVLGFTAEVVFDYVYFARHWKEDKMGNRPLHRAAFLGQVDLVSYLLGAAGAEVDPKGAQGWTPLHLAADRGHCEVAALLVRWGGADVGARDKEGQLPLHLASGEGQLDMVTYLVEEAGAGALLEARDRLWHTPLHRAALGGHLSVVRLLLNKGAFPKPMDINQKIPRQIALDKGHEKVARTLDDYCSQMESLSQ